MRSVSQIYAEAVATRNNYLQLTELNSGRSNSRMSIINLLTYVVAVCIHTYEAILDVFEVRIASVLRDRINGTPMWYVAMAKMFQYNANTESNDEMVFDEDTLKINYKTVDPTHRIITKSAWQKSNDKQSIILKVAKKNDNRDEADKGLENVQLTESELTAFYDFISNIKFVGCKIDIVSIPGDIITIKADAEHAIVYDNRYVTEEQMLSAIQKNIIDFANNFQFNNILYAQQILEVIQNTENVVSISVGTEVHISSWDDLNKQYSLEKSFNFQRLESGYIRLFDEDGSLTVNANNIKFTPAYKYFEV